MITWFNTQREGKCFWKRSCLGFFSLALQRMWLITQSEVYPWIFKKSVEMGTRVFREEGRIKEVKMAAPVASSEPKLTFSWGHGTSTNQGDPGGPINGNIHLPGREQKNSLPLDFFGELMWKNNNTTTYKWENISANSPVFYTWESLFIALWSKVENAFQSKRGHALNCATSSLIERLV